MRVKRELKVVLRKIVTPITIVAAVTIIAVLSFFLLQGRSKFHFYTFPPINNEPPTVYLFYDGDEVLTDVYIFQDGALVHQYETFYPNHDVRFESREPFYAFISNLPHSFEIKWNDGKADLLYRP